ncbi:hypothetical protein BU24DRAFT_468322 [Aaosphaeria arxii CBS 175.79]|uniref:Uncharacterized protein n=1 Tax=Aaosphaeria arxii CBS 175.79 TaxID=1450172 RepID=A0A6A5X7J2_9PLEO|nr:uncharacterized protein BU24DRAFT_468322 [Aaosphaeria arxii CBS 175.79]KAF2008903.1 hypothetical protein BU24DRAFT_468322 [Aaosphaeria arxii CBS 175.79]
MDHANKVMACRFGWSAGPEQVNPESLSTSEVSRTSSTNDFRARRFAPCRGRLYHQLSCSHRIRTDLVEDCGTNCLDPLANAPGLPFYCHECVENEAGEIWKQRESQHNASYPEVGEMTKEQYEQWYSEHRQLEVQFTNDHKIYESNLRSTTRPSNVCSALEMSREDADFASEIDSLSLAMSAKDLSVGPAQTRAQRISLPNDASEQLHWQLNSLALDRGSCGIEYSANQSPTQLPHIVADDEDLWQRPRK